IPTTDLKWDGSDRWPMLTGTAKPESRVLYWLGTNSNSLALRKGDLVLIRQKNKPDELYDLAADPSQKNDLAAQRPEVMRELGEELKKVSARDGDARVQ